MRRESSIWDRFAKSYYRKPIKDEAAYRIKLATTQEYLRPDMHILELGCGTGGTAVAHAPCVAHVTATDISPRMLRFAEERKRAAGVDNVTFTPASFEQTVQSGESYDAVLMLSLLHLLDEPQESLRKAVGMLKPDGYLVSNTPCLKGELGIFRLLIAVGGWLGLLPPVVQSFAETELMDWFETAGLKVVHNWRPEGGNAVFTICRKSASSTD